jgi:uncharacterized protein (DUF58 family)
VLTRSGWIMASSGAVLALVGRVFGIYELFVIAAATGGLVVVSAAWAVSVGLKVQVTRTVRPLRVHAGELASADLRFTNLGGRTAVLRAIDPVSTTVGADMVLGPLQPEERVSASYAVPTQRRGVIEIGPMTIEITDPFGLSTVRVQAAGTTAVTVYPRLDPIAPLPFSRGHDPHGAAHDSRSLGRIGEEFYALRDYSVGDDLRRVHWPSTARRGRLMVRQDELPRQGRVTVLLDTRATAHSDDSFERAVSAAASVVATSSRQRDLVRLVTTGGRDSGFATGRAHLESVLEFLASIRATSRGTFQATLANLQTASDGGAVVAVMGEAHEADVERVTRLRGRAGALAVVRFPEAPAASASSPRTDRGPLGRQSIEVVVPPGAAFLEAWNRAVGAESELR